MNYFLFFNLTVLVWGKITSHKHSLKYCICSSLFHFNFSSADCVIPPNNRTCKFCKNNHDTSVNFVPGFDRIVTQFGEIASSFTSLLRWNATSIVLKIWCCYKDFYSRSKPNYLAEKSQQEHNIYFSGDMWCWICFRSRAFNHHTW